MKNDIIVILVFVCLYFSCNGKKSNDYTTAETKPTTKELITRGDYLVNTIGCADCHTPKKMTPQGPVPDRSRWLMGHPETDSVPQVDKQLLTGDWLLFNPNLTVAKGPWGTSFASNLTPDDTGLGNWSFDQFKLALRKGKYKGLENSRPLMPPMPWQNLKLLTDQDIEAIFEYLKSIPAIRNQVPSYIPPNAL